LDLARDLFLGQQVRADRFASRICHCDTCLSWCRPSVSESVVAGLLSAPHPQSMYTYVQ
jgi:hypothetical protein